MHQDPSRNSRPTVWKLGWARLGSCTFNFGIIYNTLPHILDPYTLQKGRQRKMASGALSSALHNWVTDDRGIPVGELAYKLTWKTNSPGTTVAILLSDFYIYQLSNLSICLSIYLTNWPLCLSLHFHLGVYPSICLSSIHGPKFGSHYTLSQLAPQALTLPLTLPHYFLQAVVHHQE